GIPEGLIFGFPVICDEGSYRIVQGLDLSDEFSQKRIAATLAELEEERSAIQDLL
ncbi:malate dehydrogenase, partial [Neisseria sp. P0017.S010]